MEISKAEEFINYINNYFNNNGIFNGRFTYTEFSIKVTKNSTLDSRSSTNKGFLNENIDSILLILNNFNFPSNLIDKVRYYYSTHKFIIFGIDSSKLDTIYKVYFEKVNGGVGIKWDSKKYDIEYYLEKPITDLPEITKKFNFPVFNQDLKRLIYMYNENNSKEAFLLKFRKNTFLKDIPKEILDIIYTNRSKKILTIEKYPLNYVSCGIDDDKNIYYTIYYSIL